MEIISQKLITDPFDILGADIVDFNRLNGIARNSGDALKTMFGWFDNKATMTKVRVPDFYDAPVREDWPGWEHEGNHPKIGRAYWNWFFWQHPEGQLHFSDSPDFYGKIGDAMFWGDIGKVSASAFLLTQKGMGIGDLWISLLDEGRLQVVIECHIDIPEIYSQTLTLHSEKT